MIVLPARSRAALCLLAVLLGIIVCIAGASSADAASGFGIESYGLSATEEGGSADTQAGSHPYALTLETALAAGTGSHEVKNLEFALPPGVVIDLGAPTPHCTWTEFTTERCSSSAAAIGTMRMSVAGTMKSATVYNLTPAQGELAQLGYTLEGVLLVIDISIPTGSDHGMTMSMLDIPQLGVESLKLTLQGMPWTPLTLPTYCGGPLQTTAQGESWGGETASLSLPFAQLTGCNRLAFDPALGVTPDNAQSGEPSGYEVDLHVPQNDEPAGLASAQVENASVTLPAGTSLSLSATNGLTGCEEAQFSSQSAEEAICPQSSKIGLVKVVTPLLAHPLEGPVYLATPNANPLGALVALYVDAEEPVSGMTIKLTGQMSLNPITGQPTLTFDGLPQLPIGEVELHLFGGERSLLANPQVCGPAESVGGLTPWSGNAEAVAHSSFEVTEGPGGRSCSDPAPFSPGLRIEPTTVPAGGSSSFVMALTRESGEQSLSRFSIRLPAGQTWVLSGVPLCGEPQAAQGSCPAASQIGAAILRVGPIPRLASFAGHVYLTEGYGGGQYGLSIAFDTMAGPFDLGEAVVRAAIAQDPSTGALAITSDPLPQIIDGIPLQTHALELAIERSGFILEPTICEPRQILTMIEGAEGASVQMSDPFTVEGCQNPTASSTGGAGATTPAITARKSGEVSLAGTRIIVRSGGDAAVRLACAGTGTCSGKLTITSTATDGRGHASTAHVRNAKKHAKTTTIGTAGFSIPASETATVKLRLDPAGRALLRADHGRLSASLEIVESSGGSTHTRHQSVQLVMDKAR